MHLKANQGIVEILVKQRIHRSLLNSHRTLNQNQWIEVCCYKVAFPDSCEFPLQNALQNQELLTSKCNFYWRHRALHYVGHEMVGYSHFPTCLILSYLHHAGLLLHLPLLFAGGIRTGHVIQLQQEKKNSLFFPLQWIWLLHSIKGKAFGRHAEILSCSLSVY